MTPEAVRPACPKGAALVALGLTLAVGSTTVALLGRDDWRLRGGYLAVDATARMFLVVVNTIFLGIAAYVRHRERTVPELRLEASRFAWWSTLFIVAANVVVLAHHLVLGWLALEVTTLAAAPLIVRPNSPASSRASFRYFLFSSVGLGIAMLGLLCLGRALELDTGSASFVSSDLGRSTHVLATGWGRVGLVLLVLGYGTKFGLAPMYSWLPETYDEAPPATAALLAAIQSNLALVCLLRVLQVQRAAQRDFVATELLVVGLASMGVSAVSIVATRNFKRLIAYAAINHAGVIAIGLGIGGAASYGVLVYVVSNAYIKAILFLTAGKIEAHYQTKDAHAIRGLIRDLPYSGVFLMVGTFALLGFPPFGSFLGEMLILAGLVQAGQIVVFVLFCTFIAMTFVAMGRTIFPMIWGLPKQEVSWPRQTAAAVAPKWVFFAALVIMGLYIPARVNGLFLAVARSLGRP